MRRTFRLVLFTPLLLTLVGCLGTGNIRQEKSVGAEILALGEARESLVTATLTGYSGVCERLETRVRREGRTFFLSVVGIYEGPADAPCPAIAREYTQMVTLNLEGLEPGDYTVVAGDLSETFTLLDERRTAEARVESVDIVFRESDPLQVIAYVNSYFGGCDSFKDVSQRREGDTFFITVLVSAPILPEVPPCPPVEIPFTEQVMLQTADLTPDDTWFRSMESRLGLPFPKKSAKSTSQMCACCVD